MSDTVHLFIRQLHVVFDDYCFLKRTQQSFSLTEYPEFIERVQILLDQEKIFRRSVIERVEGAGFFVYFNQDRQIVFHKGDERLCVPVLDRPLPIAPPQRKNWWERLFSCCEAF